MSTDKQTFIRPHLKETFIKHYLVASLWSSTYGENGEKQLDDGEHSFSDVTLTQLAKVAGDFFDANFTLLSQAAETVGYSWEIAGHDLWLTQHHHGAGYWDGDLDEELGNALTEAAKLLKEIDLVVGDDGQIYAEGGGL